MTSGSGGATDESVDPRHRSALLAALGREAREHPLADKLLICRPRGAGRELLHALATHGVAWVGFRIQTPWELAVELAADGLASEGLQLVDQFEERALLDEAIDEVLESDVGAILRRLGDAVGFRDALAGSIRELRLACMDATATAAATLDDARKGGAIAALQRRYEARLRDLDRVDRAEVLRRAVDTLTSGAARLPAERLWLVPGQTLRGLRGTFLEALQARGARVLRSDPVEGLSRPRSLLAGDDAPPEGRLSWLFAVDEAPPPDAQPDLFGTAAEEPEVEIFAAASPMDELREVLRRTLAEGLGWDQVEIIAADWRTYGTALDSLAPRLGIEVTHAAGLPVSRTRPGRAVAGYLRWIQEDFAEEILRGLCHAGLLEAPRSSGEPLSGARLARVLRSLRIGWGRDRYLQQIGWRLESLEAEPSERERRRWTLEEIERHRRRRRSETEAVRNLVEPLLEATPEAPDRLGVRPVRVSPTALAGGVLALLEFVPADRDVDREALRRLREVLRRAAATLDRETGFHAALATLQSALDVRVPSPSAHGRVPWSSAGGYLHFSDMEHGGLSGRRRTFVVGLDSGRFPGTGLQSPLLLDHDRARLAPGRLPTSSEVLEETRWRLAALLARLRGKVTLSYAAWEAAEGRELAPASVLLQALRLRDGDGAADYARLHGTTRPIAGPVPRHGRRLESTDVWLEHLSADDLLLTGVEVVRAAHPWLDRGLTAHSARQADRLNPYNGSVHPRADRLDPRRNPDMLVSATRMETLASCPLQYLYRYVLGLRPPEDLSFEAHEWLDARERGSLFHRVYDRILRDIRDAGLDWMDEALDQLAAEVLREEIERTRRRIPPPSQVVLERESRDLESDLEVFLDMLRRQQPQWCATEWTFGFPAADKPAAELSVPGGTLRLRGAVDRIDDLRPGLRIVDYKTGSRYGYGEGTGTYRGGRRLQHALYSQATELLLGRQVVSAEYHFPTHKGEAGTESYRRSQLDRWPRILASLLEMVAAGDFPPAEDDDDLPCRFCDFRPVCRVTEEYGRIVSPPVEWGKRHFQALDEYEPLRRVRQIDD